MSLNARIRPNKLRGEQGPKKFLRELTIGVLATRGLVRHQPLVNWLGVQSRLVVVKVHTARVGLNV
ncbi:uncharacterized protein N7500_007212 [Penicillium coprophilum]|uniref:uncharacterized protein n=1 Tax=Penicillium coprophilum TaxID=36646 RepID=UPI00239AE1CD|nr:uncharacterized protein N7500_007212 [Penicillium coprophilum]KAJ5165382.1 hypothetical protein N7500_007212 [Penicillium coprophilum]